ncbi:methyltransferase [Serinibacter arcticus]|uniref:Methyltransferase n=2 Tax=Serinibacter arcticus TaxID=1655435 RepID=A0A2U1ZZG2_9MICO|nr:methyltransferase [Serinibacter arcticus]
MDDPDCDAEALRRTYGAFVVVNRLVAGWRAVYVRRLRPLLSSSRTTTLLDIGSGGGDVPRALAGWAARDGLRLDITAIDPDPRAIEFATALPPVPGVRFRALRSGDLVAEGARFDVVTSNHLLHHLDPDALAGLLADSAALALRLVVHDDIARSRLAYAGYWALTLPLTRVGRPHAPFVRDDGLVSIRRSFTPTELAAVLPTGWRVETAPFRVLAVREVGTGTRTGGGDRA